MNTINCPHCHKELPEDAMFCGHCGKECQPKKVEKSEAPELSSESQQQPVEATVGVHPWYRFWARHVDYLIFGVVLAIVFAFVYPQALSIPEAGFGLLTVFLWVFVEAFFLCTWGTTPGKWLCSTYVRDQKGNKLTYSVALGRSFNVWIRGVGFGLPLVVLITQLVAHNKLTSKGITTWDEEGNFKVGHTKINVFKVIFVVLIYAGYWMLTAMSKSQ